MATSVEIISAKTAIFKPNSPNLNRVQGVQKTHQTRVWLRHACGRSLTHAWIFNREFYASSKETATCLYTNQSKFSSSTDETLFSDASLWRFDIYYWCKWDCIRIGSCDLFYISIICGIGARFIDMYVLTARFGAWCVYVFTAKFGAWCIPIYGGNTHFVFVSSRL